jgi:serine protease Do
MDLVPAKSRQHCAHLLWPLLIAVAWGAAGRASGAAVSNPVDPSPPASLEPIAHTAAWPAWLRGGRPAFNHDALRPPDTPHPAVARIIVPEDGATAYGSGTLVDVRDQYGLVITNWHVVRDSQGTVEVKFPNGFRSHARPLKVDSDWDLAALVIWRPPIEPVQVATTAPRPGDILTIHGYGQGKYRIATGRCTGFYAPKINFPQEMLELNVEARQGDSGGPIFNQRGELAGVLFGAGEGTTIGSFAPRVDSFLATLAPDIGQVRDQTQIAVADRPAPSVHPLDTKPTRDVTMAAIGRAEVPADAFHWPSSPWSAPSDATSAASTSDASRVAASRVSDHSNGKEAYSEAVVGTWYDGLKSLLAIVGMITVALQLARIVK